MKRVWTNTLAWIAAVLAALLLALASPGGLTPLFDNDVFSHGANVPR